MPVWRDSQCRKRDDELQGQEKPPQSAETFKHHAVVAVHFLRETAIPHNQILSEVEIGPQDGHCQHKLGHKIGYMSTQGLGKAVCLTHEIQENGKESQEHMEIALEMIGPIACTTPSWNLSHFKIPCNHCPIKEIDKRDCQGDIPEPAPFFIRLIFAAFGLPFNKVIANGDHDGKANDLTQHQKRIIMPRGDMRVSPITCMLQPDKGRFPVGKKNQQKDACNWK